MNFIKIEKDKDEGKNMGINSIDDIRMARITFTFPVHKKHTFKEIEYEFDCADMNLHDTHCDVETSEITLKDLIEWQNNNKKMSWGIQVNEDDDPISLSKIIPTLTKNAKSNKKSK